MAFLVWSVASLILSTVHSQTVCTEGSLQLDAATNPPLVMLCIHGVWGYVCAKQQDDSPWNIINVGVACQQLGYIREDTFTAPPRLNAPISSDTPVHYQFVYCTGVEKRLIDCAHGDTAGLTHSSCRRGNRYRYGAVTCSTNPVVCSDPGTIRIINDTVVQICSQGDWYSICGNTWSQSQTIVTCRQLGLNTNGVTTTQMIPLINTNPPLMILFHCIGIENTLIDCSSSTVDTCTDTVAAITCGDQIESPQNVSITSTNQILNVSWDYSTINTNNTFTIICNSNNTIISTVATDMTLSVQFIGINVITDYQYNCCVSVSTINGEESDSICTTITINNDYSVDSYSSIQQIMSTVPITDLINITSSNGVTTIISTTTTSTSINNSNGGIATSISSSNSDGGDSTNIRGIVTTSASNVIETVTVNRSTSLSSSVSVSWSVGILIGLIIGIVIMLVLWLGYTVYKKQYQMKSDNTICNDNMIDNTMINPVYGGVAVPYSTDHVYSNPIDDNTDIYTLADDYNIVYQEPQ